VSKTRLLAALAAIVLICLPSHGFVSADGEAKWVKINLPSDGSGNGWVLARGSDVKCLTVASDGTLFAYANPTGTTYRLFRSKDKGVSFQAIGQVADTIVDIAVAPDNSSVIYYATASSVYRSVDSGANFAAFTPNPGGAGSGNLEITSVAVTKLGSNYIVAISIRDRDAGQYGSIYTLDESSPLSWVNTNLGNFDAYAVSFSPDFLSDRQMVAVITDETDTFVTFKVAGQNWGSAIGNARLSRDNSGLPIVVSNSAKIGFPQDYNATGDSGNCLVFVAIDAGGNNGDVYRVSGAKAPNASAATDLNAGLPQGLSNVDITGLVATGKVSSVNLIAGASQSGQVYTSQDNGRSWQKSSKEPTGTSKTYVAVTPDFSETRQIYAATSGSESALSFSRDGGVTFSQICLIDTQITAGGIIDIALSPSYARDNTIFVITFGGEYSLWKTRDGGAHWERIYSSAPASVDSLRLVRLSSGFGGGSDTVYVSGTGGGSPVIFKSVDGGRNFERYTAPCAIDVMTVSGEGNIFIGGTDGVSSFVYHSQNGGFFFGIRVLCGTQQLYSLALSPDYEKDRTVLAGNISGWAYLSTDDGTSFTPLPPNAAAPPLNGMVSVAFDPEFSKNKTVYAGSSNADKGVYRFAIGKSTFWERIDATLPSGSVIKGVGTSPQGIFYAANNKADAGLERSIDPTYELGPTFERVTRGLEGGTQLEGVWISGERIFSIDKGNTALLTLLDTLSVPVTLKTPANKTAGVGVFINHEVKNVIIDWESISGATSYRWQIDTDNDFSVVPAGFEGETGASSAALPALEPGMTYYWRARATQPNVSRWSEKWSFTTSLGEALSAPEPKNPQAGVRDIPLKPVFNWTAIAGAESYELVVATDISFTNPIISRTGEFALPATAWESSVSLDYGTTYYWKVRGINSKSKTAWSPASVFITEKLPPTLTKTAPSSQTPSPEPVAVRPAPEPLYFREVAQLDLPGWMVALIVMLIVSIIVLVGTVTLLVIKLTSARERGRLRNPRE